MLILLINFLCMTIGMGIIKMLCRGQSNDVFQVVTNFGVDCFGENMMHMDCPIFHMCGFKMFCLSTTILVIKQTQKSFRFGRLIMVISFIHFNRMSDGIFFSRNSFRLVRIDISEVIAIIHMQNILKAFLEDAGYQITIAGDGMEGIAAFHKAAYDLVLLDIMMPKLDGYTVCEMIRRESNTPVILLTALDDEESQMKGFDLMADDYITKPFSVPLVVRRIEAVLRRAKHPDEDSAMLTYREIQLDVKNYKVFVSGQEVVLTAREYEILRLFMENKGCVFTREQLLDLVWNYDYMGDDRIINTHIKNIRKKLGVECIETIRGVGYRIDKENQK